MAKVQTAKKANALIDNQETFYREQDRIEAEKEFKAKLIKYKQRVTDLKNKKKGSGNESKILRATMPSSGVATERAR